ncbi:MAG: substrate-binding domain-containing protein [Pseudomonadota bacterium]
MNLRELSGRLGLSQTTVSRALNGYPEVSETTRQRVVAAAEALGYQPDARARGLATGQARAIGHVIAGANREGLANVVFADVIAGVGETCGRHGYDLLMSVVSDEAEEAAYRTLARRRSVDGVILHGPIRNDPRIPLLRELGLPFVVHGRSSGAKSPYAWLDVNNRRAIERATGFLADLGHRRIALVNGEEQHDFAFRRREGYLAGLAARGLGEDTNIMRSAQMTEAHGHGSASAMLTGPNPPTAFIAASIVIAMGVRRAIEGRGLVMGRDVSVICFDDEISYFPNGANDGTGEPIFTALRSPVRAAGRRCAEILLQAIEAPGAAPVTELWEADLVLGASTGPVCHT